jgi:sigma-E factor negative regulatory protein RseA
MVMTDDISRLMDGELPDSEIDAVCGRLRSRDAMTTWVCYHVIGDALRDSGVPSPGFAARFAARLAAEPAVLAPGPRRNRPLPLAWAAAATVAAVAVVGWVALATFDTPSTAIAKAREAAAVSSAQVRRPSVPADYLLAHREYAPTTQIQAYVPNLRAASVPAAEVRP